MYSAHIGEYFKLKAGFNTINGKIDCLPLTSDIYFLNLWLGVGESTIDFHKQALTVYVKDGAIRKGGPISTRNGYPVISNTKFKIL